MFDPMNRLPEPEYVKNQRELDVPDGECRTLKGLSFKQRQEWYRLREDYLAREDGNLDIWADVLGRTDA